MLQTAFFLLRTSHSVIIHYPVKQQRKVYFYTVSRAVFGLISCVGASVLFAAESHPTKSSNPAAAVVNDYCINCHDADTHKGELDLAKILSDPLTEHAEAWEKVIRKVRARQMPPAGKKRPDEATYDS